MRDRSRHRQRWEDETGFGGERAKGRKKREIHIMWESQRQTYKACKKYCDYVEGTQFSCFLKRKHGHDRMSRCTLFTAEGTTQKAEVVRVINLPIRRMTTSKPETEGCCKAQTRNMLTASGHFSQPGWFDSLFNNPFICSLILVFILTNTNCPLAESLCEVLIETLHHFPRQEQLCMSWLTHTPLPTWQVGLFQEQWLQGKRALISKLVVELIEWTTRD